MADVFLSYRRDERSAIEQIASRLRELGLTVWFDASMSAGETFNAEIDREARAAKSILVCWSPAARESKWVNAEAMIGFEQDKLAACYVAGPDTFSAPTPFNTSHAEDLRAWLAAPSEVHAGWKSVLRRIGRLSGRADIESWGILDSQATLTELTAWIETNNGSPLLTIVDAQLRTREQLDAERARLEQAARDRRLKEEDARFSTQTPARTSPRGRVPFIVLGAVAIATLIAIGSFFGPRLFAADETALPPETAALAQGLRGDWRLHSASDCSTPYRVTIAGDQLALVGPDGSQQQEAIRGVESGWLHTQGSNQVSSYYHADGSTLVFRYGDLQDVSGELRFERCQ